MIADEKSSRFFVCFVIHQLDKFSSFNISKPITASHVNLTPYNSELTVFSETCYCYKCTLRRRILQLGQMLKFILKTPTFYCKARLLYQIGKQLVFMSENVTRLQ